MNVPAEVERLRYHPKTRENLTVPADQDLALDGLGGNSIELSLEMSGPEARACGVKVCRSANGEEETVVFYDAVEKKLKVDTTKASLTEGPKSVEAGPFELKVDEPLQLRVFVDKSVVEVFANGRQAVMRRVYPSRADSVGVALFSRGGPARVKTLHTWDIMPSNPY